MNDPRPRPPAFFINGRPDVPAAVQAGVQWLADWTADHGGIPPIITPGREPEGRVLQMAPLAGRVTRQTFLTMFRSPWMGGAVLAVWSDDKVLGQIDDDYRVAAVCAVLDSLNHAPLWLKARQPKQVGGPLADVPAAPSLDPVVVIALEHLTNGVNLGTGLVHPSDKSRAIQTLKALALGHHRLDPDDAHAWAMQHGWRSDGADDLREFVIGVAKGKRYKTEPFGSPSAWLAMWEREAAEGK